MQLIRTYVGIFKKNKRTFLAYEHKLSRYFCEKKERKANTYLRQRKVFFQRNVLRIGEFLQQKGFAKVIEFFKGCHTEPRKGSMDFMAWIENKWSYLSSFTTLFSFSLFRINVAVIRRYYCNFSLQLDYRV